MKKRIYWELFSTFFKIGLFTFGGGYAMIPIIEDICSEKKHWITHEDMMNVTIVAESTPGPVAINCSTFVGYRQAGISGAVTATLGVVLPSFLVIYAISMFLDQFLEITLVANAFRGIQIAVGLLIFNAAIRMVKLMEKSAFSWTVFACAFVAMVLIDLFALNFSSIAMLLIAAVVGILFYLLGRLRKGGRKA